MSNDVYAATGSGGLTSGSARERIVIPRDLSNAGLGTNQNNCVESK